MNGELKGQTLPSRLAGVFFSVSMVTTVQIECLEKTFISLVPIVLITNSLLMVLHLIDQTQKVAVDWTGPKLTR